MNGLISKRLHTRVSVLLLISSAIFVLMLPGTADAVSLRLTAGGQEARCDDGTFTGVGGATGACTVLAPGHVTFIGTVGGFSINVSTALTYPALGSSDFAQFHLDSVNTGTGLLLIEASEVGYTGPPSPATFAFGGGGINNLGTSAFEAYLNDGNTLFATESLIAAAGPFSGPFSFSEEGTASFSDTFSLTLRATITHLTAGVSSFDADITPRVSEPSAAALFALGLLALVFADRRRMLESVRA